MLRLSGKLKVNGASKGRHVPLPLTKALRPKPLLMQQILRNSSSKGSKVVSTAGFTLRYVGAMAFGLAAAGGSAVIYANYDKQFRSQLEDRVPYASEMFNSLYGELLLTPDERQRYQSPSVVLEDGSMLKMKKFKLKEEDEEGEVTPPEADPPTPPSQVVTVSSVDQSSVSSVDLDISNRKRELEKQAQAEREKVLEPTKKATSDATPKIDESKSREKEAAVDKSQEHQGNSAGDEKAVVSTTPTSDHESVKGPPHMDASPATPEPPLKDEQPLQEQRHDDSAEGSVFLDNNTTDTDPSDPQTLEVLLQASADDLRLLRDRAIALQTEAASSIKAYVEQLGKALSISSSDPDYDSIWLATAAAERESQSKIDEAKSLESRVQESVNKLEHMIRAVRHSGASKTADLASDLGARVYLDLEKCTGEIKNACADLERMNDFHQLVGHAEQELTKELKDIAPELHDMVKESMAKSSDDGKQDGASKALLAYALKKSELLTRALEQQKVDEKVRLQQLLSSQQQESEAQLLSQLEARTEALKKEALSEREKLEANLLSKYEAEIRRQLKRQAAAHRDHLSDVVRVQAEELSEQHKADATRRLQDQELEHQHDASILLARLRAILASVDLLNDIECRQRKAQELLLAVQSLAVAMGDEFTVGKSRSLVPEIVAIGNTSDHNSDVFAALQTIPNQASESGVNTEEFLRERFDKVHTICRRVAMVDENGGSLWTYALSWVRSWLTFDVNTAEHIADAVDPNEIDTYAVLAKARFHVKAGDLEQAVKFMTLLRGLPRQLATDWIKDTVTFLETKQASDFLTAYSLSLGQATPSS